MSSFFRITNDAPLTRIIEAPLSATRRAIEMTPASRNATDEELLTGGSGVGIGELITSTPSGTSPDLAAYWHRSGTIQNVGTSIRPITMDSWDPPVPPQQPSLRTIPSAGSPISWEPIESSRDDYVMPWVTRENIRAWANGRLCSIPIGREREIIESLARIVVREEVLP